MWQELIDTIGNGFTAFFNLWGDVFSSWGNRFQDTPLGLLVSFVWGILKFIWYAVKSIYFLVINLFNNVTGSLTSYLNDTFSVLGVFMGDKVTVLISLFQFVLLLIVFGFIVRTILGKFHYQNKKK